MPHALSENAALSLLMQDIAFCDEVFNCSVSPEDRIRRGVDLFQVVITPEYRSDTYLCVQTANRRFVLQSR
jgi:hypothetical protein